MLAEPCRMGAACEKIPEIRSENKRQGAQSLARRSLQTATIANEHILVHHERRARLPARNGSSPEGVARPILSGM